MASAPRDEGGFTLIELLVAIAISAFVIGGASSALIVVFRNYADAATRLVQSHDAQLLSLWDSAALTALGGGGLRRFSALPPQRREEVLLSW